MRDTPLVPTRYFALLLVMMLSAMPAAGQTALPQEAIEAQQAQAELQSRIDAADDESREMLAELRRLETETRRLEARSDALAPRLDRQVEQLASREVALDTLAETREMLPRIEQSLVNRLQVWVASDLPFLRDERLARAEELEAGMVDSEASAADRLDRIFAAWRTELAYGREIDAWRGILAEGDVRREVDFLRLGRVGFYYLTPDGREGAVWRADAESWQALDEAGRAELRLGLRIARDQRAPELLTLPVSQPLVRVDAEETS